jgi:hypothetical protein
MDSYKMRMYKRRLWQERAKIVAIGASIWLVAAILIALGVQAAR